MGSLSAIKIQLELEQSRTQSSSVIQAYGNELRSEILSWET